MKENNILENQQRDVQQISIGDFGNMLNEVRQGNKDLAPQVLDALLEESECQAKFHNLLQEEDKQWLLALDNLKADCIVLSGMYREKWRYYDELFTDEDTGEEVVIERTELIDGTSWFERDKNEARALYGKICAADLPDADVRMVVDWVHATPFNYMAIVEKAKATGRALILNVKCPELAAKALEAVKDLDLVSVLLVSSVEVAECDGLAGTAFPGLKVAVTEAKGEISDLAVAIAEKYSLILSPQARALLDAETPKTLDNVTTQITGSVRELCTAAAKVCTELGYEPIMLTDMLSCQAKEAGSFLASILKTHAGSGKKLAFLAGGETVVYLTGKGKGGRNQELALSAAIGIDGIPGAAVFSVGSDGTDGPTDAAGGYVDYETAATLKSQGISIYDVLQDNDAYHALEKCNGLVITGPTGTNAVEQAKYFNEVVPLTGIVLTKLDGTAKGGMIISIRRELNIPVKFIGVGEGVDDLQPFDPEEFANGLFGE